MFQDSRRHEKKIKKSQSLREYEAAVGALFREGDFAPFQGYQPKL